MEHNVFFSFSFSFLKISVTRFHHPQSGKALTRLEQGACYMKRAIMSRGSFAVYLWTALEILHKGSWGQQSVLAKLVVGCKWEGAAKCTISIIILWWQLQGYYINTQSLSDTNIHCILHTQTKNATGNLPALSDQSINPKMEIKKTLGVIQKLPDIYLNF